MLQQYDGRSPNIDPGAWVHTTAVILGDVTIARGAGIWPYAVLRGDMGPIEIGEDTNLQDAVICHDTTDISTTRIGARCTVGHRVILHGCIVEDDCLVGMGAIIMDNVRVGAGSLIAAGTLVIPNRVIPPGSVVMGSPGRVVRPVGARDLEMIESAWTTYAKKAAYWLRKGSEGADEV